MELFFRIVSEIDFFGVFIVSSALFLIYLLFRVLYFEIKKFASVSFLVSIPIIILILLLYSSLYFILPYILFHMGYNYFVKNIFKQEGRKNILFFILVFWKLMIPLSILLLVYTFIYPFLEIHEILSFSTEERNQILINNFYAFTTILSYFFVIFLFRFLPYKYMQMKIKGFYKKLDQISDTKKTILLKKKGYMRCIENYFEQEIKTRNETDKLYLDVHAFIEDCFPPKKIHYFSLIIYIFIVFRFFRINLHILLFMYIFYFGYLDQVLDYLEEYFVVTIILLCVYASIPFSIYIYKKKILYSLELFLSRIKPLFTADLEGLLIIEASSGSTRSKKIDLFQKDLLSLERDIKKFLSQKKKKIFDAKLLFTRIEEYENNFLDFINGIK